MPKYFFNAAKLNGNLINISGDTAHHIVHVLRMKTGDSLVLCDGANTDYFCEISQISKQSKEHVLTLLVNDTQTCITELPFQVTLYQALPKGDKLDLIVQKCTELGISRIVPVETARSVSRLKDIAKKTERYQRIATAAAGQSMRGIIPNIATPIKFEDAVEQIYENETTIVLFEKEKLNSFKHALDSPSKNINIWIGPEGGFLKEEIEILCAKKATTASLGARILRTETAAIATMAFISMAF